MAMGSAAPPPLRVSWEKRRRTLSSPACSRLKVQVTSSSSSTSAVPPLPAN